MVHASIVGPRTAVPVESLRDHQALVLLNLGSGIPSDQVFFRHMVSANRLYSDYRVRELGHVNVVTWALRCAVEAREAIRKKGAIRPDLIAATNEDYVANIFFPVDSGRPEWLEAELAEFATNANLEDSTVGVWAITREASGEETLLEKKWLETMS